MKEEKMLSRDTQYVTDKILISLYSSAQALKEKIRTRIQIRQKCGLLFWGMRSYGPYLILCFRRAVEARPGFGLSKNMECCYPN